MKKLLLLLLLSPLVVAQTFTFSGHVLDGTGTAPANGTVTFNLIGTGNQQCRVAGTGEIAPTKSVFTVNSSTGAYSGTLYRNDFITCGNQQNTQWQYVIFDGTLLRPACSLAQIVSGSAVNIDSTACSNTTPVVTPPTGDTTYCRLDGSNCGITGSISVAGSESVGGALTAQSVNNVLWVGPGTGEYATCAAAVTAAGTTNKTLIIIGSNYTGAQCPANLASSNTNVIIWAFDTASNNPPNTSPGIGTIFNFYDGNVLALDRSQFTMSSMPASANSAVVTGYWITAPDGLTVGTGNTIDGISAEVDFAHTLTGTLPNATVAEHSITLGSTATGGTITNARALLGYISTASGSTTAITNATGVYSRGCFTISGTVPSHCVGVLAEDQGNKGSVDNFALYGIGRNLIGYSSVTNTAALWYETHLNVRTPVLFNDSSDLLNLAATSATGIGLEDSGQNIKALTNASGFQIRQLNNHQGLQILNTTTTCTTGASVGATCTTAAISLPVAEADTAYKVSCTGKGLTNVPVVIATTNSSASQFTITIAALTAAAASFTSYDCFVGHN